MYNQALQIGFKITRYTSNLSLHLCSNVVPLYLRRHLESFKIIFTHHSVLVYLPPTNRPATRYISPRPPTFVTSKTNRFRNFTTYQVPLFNMVSPPQLNQVKSMTKMISIGKSKKGSGQRMATITNLCMNQNLPLNRPCSGLCYLFGVILSKIPLSKPRNLQYSLKLCSLSPLFSSFLLSTECMYLLMSYSQFMEQPISLTVGNTPHKAAKLSKLV